MAKGYFSEDAYLRAHPDVAAAVAVGQFSSGREHYEQYGRSEGRALGGDNATPSVRASERYVDTEPSPQNIINLFQDEWLTDLSVIGSVEARPGTATLLEDQRIYWAQEELGPFQGLDILELGPLEGAHSYMLERMGAGRITAIEANTRAFLKCLCARELFNLKVTKFLLGDFNPFLDRADRFDVIVACGVLYHMSDPLRLLQRLCNHSDRIFIWTHYYDPNLIAERDDSALFTPIELDKERSYAGARRRYPQEAMDWIAFCGGPSNDAVWLTRDTILRVLEAHGMTVVTAFDHPRHVNGPALAFCAHR